MMCTQVVRTQSLQLKFRDGYLRLPTPKNEIFSELLPAVAVRRVPGNSTLYSVSYRWDKKKKAKMKKKVADVSSTLMVTVYQSDLRAKKFRALVKMKLDARVALEDPPRCGVAVAVDEVAECVFVVYTHEETPELAQLLLRQVKLTLAAADARGVRRLQRPSTGEPPSVIFEAEKFNMQYVGLRNPPSKKRAASCILADQLLFDGAALLLYMSFGLGSNKAVGAALALAQLKLNKKRASMNVLLRRSLTSLSSGVQILPGAGHHKFLLQFGPREPVAMEILMAPTLVKVGSVADAACQRLADASRTGSPMCLQLAGQEAVVGWMALGSIGRRQIFYCSCSTEETAMIVAVRDLARATPPKVVGVFSAPLVDALDDWARRHPSYSLRAQPSVFNMVGGWFLISVMNSSSTKPAILHANVRSLLPPSTACAACHAKLSADSKKICKVCRIRGFTKYSWAFGCHFCSAACLRDAWPQHSRLHRTPPLRKWTDADWKQWRRDHPQPRH